MTNRRLRSITFVLTASCNLRCAYCYRASASDGAITPERVRRALQDLLPQCEPTVECAFTGGEPLLALPVLRESVEAGERIAASLGRRIRWTVLTNGLLVDDDAMAFFDAHRFSIKLSLDGVESSQRARGTSTFATLDRLLD